VIFHCHTCGVRFKRDKQNAKHCSNECRSITVRKVTPELLKQYAVTGERQREIAKALGVHENTIKAALRRYGLYREWSQMRYA
jgi:transposase